MPFLPLTDLRQGVGVRRVLAELLPALSGLSRSQLTVSEATTPFNALYDVAIEVS